MHLMNEAINHLRTKGVEITEDEANGALCAILLHDIGHGPFSHVLEDTLIDNVTHEDISIRLIEKINDEKNGKLDTAIAIFKNKYPKKFLHQLVSSQLDMDRMDYLSRDSFFSGVAEGTIGAARIIKMLNVVNDSLAIEAKGIYSIENFLIARRLMYWQVYLHKTAVAAECMLINTLRRAKELSSKGEKLFASDALSFFLTHTVDKDFFISHSETIENFVLLDDSDIYCSLKSWMNHSDIVLSTLSQHFINRKLFKVKMDTKPFDEKETATLLEKYRDSFHITKSEAQYFFSNVTLQNDTYKLENEAIKIFFNDGTVKDISEASEILNTNMLSKEMSKFCLCFLPTNS
jgi:HD superfamily phosphohydrolase